ncbi:MAG: polysaccharide deacetylase family protein [Chitinophagaceae bacterium]
MERTPKAAIVATPSVLVFAETLSLRLHFVLDWLLKERLQLSYSFTQNKAEAAAHPHCISYGFLENAASVHASGFLEETAISDQEIRCEEWQGLFTLFHDSSSPCDIQFDMLAGIFFLLSRYEEYQGFEPDEHGRFPAEASLLFKNGVLERPIVDEWVEAFRLFLEDIWKAEIPVKAFSYQPSYDIDIAWSFKHKGWKRWLGGALREISSGKISDFSTRMRVLRGKEDDPYNAFTWLASLHFSNNIQPIWFYLAALKPSRFDKNISPQNRQMIELIRAFAEGAKTGIHPSYYSSEKPALLEEEKKMMERILRKPVRISRQHFIRLRFPKTYQRLIQSDIQEDYSMGYPNQLGFRAGTGSSFLWYDLSKEETSNLRIHPFVFMDTAAHYHLVLSAEEAFERLRLMAEKLKAVNGELITVMHNFSLGTDKEWIGWREQYERFLKQMSRFEDLKI